MNRMMILGNDSFASSLSVVIPTYKRERRLCETLQALLELRDSFLELLVVDQTPHHLPETKSFLAQLPGCARIIRMPYPNLPAARNAGANESAGDIILYLDDDIKPLRSLIRAHLRHYQDPTVGGVAGRLISPYGEVKKLDPRFHTSPFPWRYVRFDQDWDQRDVGYAPGGNMSFRRHLIFAAGGFDENFVGNAFREETDFCIRLRKFPYRIVFNPEAAVIHFWKTEGGCDHIRLGDFRMTSFLYYRDFVQNNFYFFLKNTSRFDFPELLWELYRNHIGNKDNTRYGSRHLFLRHLAFCLGLLSGYKAWRHYEVSRNLKRVPSSDYLAAGRKA